MGDTVETLDTVAASHSAAAPNVLPWRPPADVRLYLRLHRVVEHVQNVLGISFVAAGLGALTDRRRFAIDRCYYDRERMYHTARYNEQGLFDWEREAVGRFFGGCTPLIVACAGGGREVIALRRMGLDVSAFECHQGLATFANTLLQRLGFAAAVQEAARDECPPLGTLFSGAIVGWGGYMLIRGRERRVRFLRGVRALVASGAPLLVSFIARPRSRRFAVAAALANSSRYLLGGTRVEVGDYLVPNFVHFFTRDEIDGELTEAGFALASYNATPYGHAVAHAT